ncbi:hypothetical protein Leryth_015033, partial [Lithospermum erythrorhizon]
LKCLQTFTLNFTNPSACGVKRTFWKPTKCFCGALCTGGGDENKKTEKKITSAKAAPPFSPGKPTQRMLVTLGLSLAN